MEMSIKQWSPHWRGVLKEAVAGGFSGFISIKIKLHAYNMMRVPSRPANESSSK